MKLFDLMYGRKKAVEAPAIWKRKKCKSCVKYFKPDCPNYISRDGILKWFKRPLDPACKDWKGLKKISVMRYPHKYRLPRKFKKEIKKSASDWFEFIYSRIVAEEYPYAVCYNNKPKYFILKKQGYKFGLCRE